MFAAEAFNNCILVLSHEMVFFVRWNISLGNGTWQEGAISGYKSAARSWTVPKGGEGGDVDEGESEEDGGGGSEATGASSLMKGGVWIKLFQLSILNKKPLPRRVYSQ